LEEGLSIAGTASQRFQVEADEGVDLTGVTADVEELRVLHCGREQVGLEIWNGVVIADGALVPVVRDLFPAFGPFEVTGGASDGEEGLENFLVEDALVKVLVCHMVERFIQIEMETYFGILGGFIGHKAIYEGVGCGLHGYTSEWTVEGLRIVLDALVESVCPEVCKDI
jgi:hypothetical protein